MPAGKRFDAADEGGVTGSHRSKLRDREIYTLAYLQPEVLDGIQTLAIESRNPRHDSSRPVKSGRPGMRSNRHNEQGRRRI